MKGDYHPDLTMRLIFFRHHAEGDAPEPGMEGWLKVWIGFHSTLQRTFPEFNSCRRSADEPFDSDIGALLANALWGRTSL